ncbi:MAG: tRNA pseudouridine(38-40) synthase TruA [Bacillota bacterium]
MPRIMMILEYEGTRYAGWQRQKNGVSVQQVVEDALFSLTGERVTVHASGRTDSSVHALGQVAHFDTKMRMSPDKFAFALNTFLPKDVRVLHSREVHDGFHARFDARAKLYRYDIHNAPHASAIHRNTRLHVYRPLNIGAMREAAAMVTGTHDFAAFQAAGSAVRSTVRTVTRSVILQEDELVSYEIMGNGFLYNMVRIITGTLLEIGMNRRPPQAMQDALNGRMRTLAGPTAPPHGLTLVKVFYDGPAGENLG